MESTQGAAAGQVLLVGSVASEQGANTVSTPASSFARAQLRGRYDMIVLGSEVLAVDAAWQRLIAHNCAAHLQPGGTLSVSASTDVFSNHAAACGFTLIADQGAHTWWRRTERWTIHDAVAEARDGLERVTPTELHTAIAATRPPLVVDVRIPEDRRRHGMIANAIPIARTVLEWRADPTSGYAHPAIESLERPLVVVCNEGYSSSLAAATLQRLGFVGATDLIGGMVAWIGDDYPVGSAPEADETFTPLEDLT